MQGASDENLFAMSPPVYLKSQGAPASLPSMSEGSSLSLGGTGLTHKAPSAENSSASGRSGISSRPPFGELMNNTFEFKTAGQAAKAAAAPPAAPKPAANANPFVSLKQRADSVASAARDQGGEPATPATAESRDTSTPVATAVATPQAATMAAAGASVNKQILLWSDILLWNEPLQSLVVFFGGLAAFWALTWITYGTHNMTLVSGLSYLLLLDVGLNFFRSIVSKPWHDKCLWGGPAQMKHFLTRMNSLCLHMAAAHDKFLSAANPFVTLKVGLALWALAWIGTFMSLWWFVLWAYLFAFTVPALYVGFQEEIEAVGRSIRAATMDKVDRAGLPRTVRFTGALVFSTVLFFTCSYTQFAIGFFVALTYCRTLLVPKEIDSIRTFAAPYTHSVQKLGKHVSDYAGDAFMRMSTGPATRTKSHFRKE